MVTSTKNFKIVERSTVFSAVYVTGTDNIVWPVFASVKTVIKSPKKRGKLGAYLHKAAVAESSDAESQVSRDRE